MLGRGPTNDILKARILAELGNSSNLARRMIFPKGVIRGSVAEVLSKFQMRVKSHCASFKHCERAPERPTRFAK